MRRQLTRVIAIAAVVLPAAAQAQKATRCPVITPTLPWVKKQQSFTDSAGATFTDPALRAKLLEAAGLDAKSAFSLERGFRVVGSAPVAARDTALMTTLREMASKRQWPGRASVGAAGVHAAWLVSQGDSLLAAAAQKRMMEAGLGESSPAEVAVMEDANRVRIGRGQLYGTHFTRNASGALVLYKLEDSAHVDMRREGAWLPTLSASACWAKSGQP